MHPILFELGPLPIYTYGFFVFLGVICGYYVCLKEGKRAGIESRIVSDLIFWTILSSFVGARVLYIIVEFKSFLLDPVGVLFSRSGFVFYGGAIFGFITVYFLTRRYGLKFLRFADVLGIATPLAHGIGRIGCFFYGCCYGRVTHSFIGVAFPPDSPAYCLGEKVIPTQLIESFFLFIIFFIMLILRKRKKFDGQLIFTYFILYGVLRFIVEFFRGDPRGHILFLSTSQIISIGIILLSAIVLLRKAKKTSRRRAN